MNPEAEAKLKKILAKELHELTVEDKAFLKARWTYVGKSSRVKFAKVLDEKIEPVEKKEEEPAENPFEESDGEDEVEE